MIKQLLTATALVAMVSTGAMAADARPGTGNESGAGTTMDRGTGATGTTGTDATTRPGATPSATTGAAGGATVFSNDRQSTPMTSQNGYITGGQGQVLVSNLMGKTVYSGNGDNAEKVGDISDVLMSSDGRVHAAVIGVGGFLGIGEKDVAVEFDRLRWSVDKNNDRRLSIAASKADLENAPAFRR